MILNKPCPPESRKFQARNITTLDHVWTSLDKFGAFRCIWTRFDTFGRVWMHLDRVWTSVDRVWKSLEGVWRSLEKFGGV